MQRPTSVFSVRARTHISSKQEIIASISCVTSQQASRTQRSARDILERRSVAEANRRSAQGAGRYEYACKLVLGICKSQQETLLLFVAYSSGHPLLYAFEKSSLAHFQFDGEGRYPKQQSPCAITQFANGTHIQNNILTQGSAMLSFEKQRSQLFIFPLELVGSRKVEVNFGGQAVHCPA